MYQQSTIKYSADDVNSYRQKIEAVYPGAVFSSYSDTNGLSIYYTIDGVNYRFSDHPSKFEGVQRSFSNITGAVDNDTVVRTVAILDKQIASLKEKTQTSKRIAEIAAIEQRKADYIAQNK